MCLVLIVCICELGRNWVLFLVINNSEVYCLISVFSWFVIFLVFRMGVWWRRVCVV